MATKKNPVKEKQQEKKTKKKKIVQDFENKLISGDDIHPENIKAKLMVYGAPGCGKSHFGLATTRRALIACVEYEQMKRTHSNVKETGRWNNESNIYPAKNVADLARLIRVLKTVDHGYEVVVLDHLSEIQRMLKGQLIINGKDRTLEVLNQAEWQVLIDKTLNIVRTFRDLPIHFVCLAHYNEKYDDSNKKFIRPSVQGKSLPSQIIGSLNLTAYMKKTVNGSMVDRDLIFEAGDGIFSKNDKCFRSTEVADLDFILDKFEGKVDRSVSYADWAESMGIEI